MLRSRNFLLGMLSVLCTVMCLPFVIQVNGVYSNYILDVSAYYCFVPISLAVLFLSPIIPGTSGLLSRVLLGLWLALFLWFGFGFGFRLVFHENPNSMWWPWTGYLVYGLILSVPILVISSKAIASLGPIKLTVCAGFILVLANGVHNLYYGDNWFGMYTHLRLGMWATPDGSNWTSYFLVWLKYSDWIGYRLITYLGLGYLLAKRKGFLLGMVISILVALADNTVGWLVFLPDDGDFEAAPFSFVLQYDLPELLKTLFAQVADLSIIALLGALVALVRWRPMFRYAVRFVSVTKMRYRPARQITPSIRSD